MLLLLVCSCLLVSPIALVSAQASSKKVVCFYNSQAYYREDSGKFLVADLEKAIPFCSHVVYGYAKLDAEDFKIKPYDADLDPDTGKGNYKAVTSLKKKHPTVPFLISLGGWADTNDTEKYMTLLRDSSAIRKFVSSVVAFTQQYDFDGIDLAWQFPLVRVKERSAVGSAWHKLKKTFGAAEGSKDPQAAEHKAGFSSLIKQLKLALRPDGHLLTTSVIPHTNYTVYYDLREVMPSLDAIHLHAFDYLTAEDKISPDSADFPAPLYRASDRRPELNIDYQVNWFINNGAPSNRLILGIPAFGRTWEIEEETKSGTPPLPADGPGDKEHLTKEKGLLSYAELCTMSENYPGNTRSTPGLLRVVQTPQTKQGTYSYRNEHGDKEGIWVGHEDLNTAANKAVYAKTKTLGGIGIHDLTLDDFRGVCTGDRFPILKAARNAL